MFLSNRSKRKAGVAILTLHKIEVRTQIVIRDKEGHYLRIKESIEGEVILFLNIYQLIQDHLNIGSRY